MSVQLTLPLAFEDAPAPAKPAYEYFVLLSPDSTIKAKMKAKKKELHAEVKLSRENRVSEAHISLFKFMDLQDEAQILSCVQHAVDGVIPFTVDLAGLEVFDHGMKKSVVLTVKEPGAIKDLHDRLLAELGYKAKSMTPHLTIARSIPDRDLKRIGNLSNYYFGGSFLCASVTILRRPIHKKMPYELFSEISLQDIILPSFSRELEPQLAW